MPYISVSKLCPSKLNWFLAHGPFIRDRRQMIKKDISRLIVKAANRIEGGRGHLKNENLGARFNSWAPVTGLTRQGRKPILPSSCLECLLLIGGLEWTEANTWEGWSSWASTSEVSDQPEASYRVSGPKYRNISLILVNKCWKETTGAESACTCEEITMVRGSRTEKSDTSRTEMLTCLAGVHPNGFVAYTAYLASRHLS